MGLDRLMHALRLLFRAAMLEASSQMAMQPACPLNEIAKRANVHTPLLYFVTL